MLEVFSPVEFPLKSTLVVDIESGCCYFLVGWNAQLFFSGRFFFLEGSAVYLGLVNSFPKVCVRELILSILLI